MVKILKFTARLVSEKREGKQRRSGMKNLLHELKAAVEKDRIGNTRFVLKKT